MNRNPLIPFALIAMLGLALIIGLSFNGLDNMKEIADAENGHAEDKDTTEVVTDPEELYQGKCMSCHGGDLGGGLGPALTDIGSKYNKEEIQDIITNGLPGGMPAFDAQTAEILAEWLSGK